MDIWEMRTIITGECVIAETKLGIFSVEKWGFVCNQVIS